MTLPKIRIAILIACFIVGVLGTLVVHTIAPSFLVTRGVDHPNEISIEGGNLDALVGRLSLRYDSFDDRQTRIQGATTFEDIFALDSRFDQELATYKYLDSLSQKEVVALLEKSKSFASSNGEHIQQVIFSRLASFDPQSALTFVDGFDLNLRGELVRIAFTEWATQDLEAAAIAIRKLPKIWQAIAAESIVSMSRGSSPNELDRFLRGLDRNPFFVESVVREALRHFGSNPQVEFANLLYAFRESDLVDDVIAGASGIWIRSEGFDALNQINQILTDSYQRHRLLPHIVRVATQENPEVTLRFVSNLTNPQEYDHLVPSVLWTWTELDPSAAFEAAERIDLTRKSYKCRQRVVDLWAKLYPQTLVENVSNFSADFAMYAYDQVLPYLTKSNGLEAMLLLANIPNPRTKRRVQRSVFQEWLVHDFESANAWLDSNAELKDDLTFGSMLVKRQALHNLEEAFQEIARRPDAQSKQLERVVIEFLVNQDMEQAIKALPMLRSDNRLYGYERVAFYLKRSNPRRALSIGKSLSEEDRRKFYGEVVRRFPPFTPDILVQLVDEIPTAELRSKAALRTINRYLLTGRLSEKQLDELRQRMQAEHIEAIDPEEPVDMVYIN